jgi:hypothetical protein
MKTGSFAGDQTRPIRHAIPKATATPDSPVNKYVKINLIACEQSNEKKISHRWREREMLSFHPS